MVTKDDIQTAARQSFAVNNHWGLIAMATRTGKSKIGVDESSEVVELNPQALIVLAVPTIKLRDVNWRNEYIKWGQEDIYNNNVKSTCYASITNLKNLDIDLLILDEGHWLTEISAIVFRNNRVKRCLVITATPPNPKGNDTDIYKIELFKKLKLSTIFRYSLTEAVADGIVAPYTIKVVECRLDNTTKYIEAGPKAKRFYQTEKQRYAYLSKLIQRLYAAGKPEAASFKILERTQLIRKLKSKTEVARRIINRHIFAGDRYLVFCGSVEQAESLGNNTHTYHSKLKGKTKDQHLNSFLNQDLDILYVVDAINEGMTIENMNGSVIVQGNSNIRVLAQRLGRNIGIRDDHEAVIWVLVTADTQDEEWFKKAIEDDGIDKSRIEYYHYRNVI